MLNKIDHIGIAVSDLKAVIETYRDGFGLEPEFEETVDDQKVNVAGFQIGESMIEFLEPVSAESPISKFIEKKGNGIHHIAFKVDDLSAVLQSLKEKGYRLIDEYPRKGAEGKKIAFLHPKSFNGILIELSQSLD